MLVFVHCILSKYLVGSTCYRNHDGLVVQALFYIEPSLTVYGLLIDVQANDISSSLYQYSHEYTDVAFTVLGRPENPPGIHKYLNTV
jgi:hypothetical protein